MGVSGSGKTTVGQVLAQKLGWDFSMQMIYTLREHRQLEGRWASLAPKRRSGGVKWGQLSAGKARRVWVAVKSA